MSNLDIGAMGNIGNPSHPAGGRMFGLKPLSHLVSDVGAPLLAGAMRRREVRRKGIKDYNDQPGRRMIGTTHDGRIIYEETEAAQPSWMPAE